MAPDTFTICAYFFSSFCTNAPNCSGVVGIGCSLVQPVLMHQIGTFDPKNWQHNLVLARLFAAEAALIGKGELGHDFALFVAVRRG